MNARTAHTGATAYLSTIWKKCLTPVSFGRNVSLQYHFEENVSLRCQKRTGELRRRVVLAGDPLEGRRHRLHDDCSQRSPPISCRRQATVDSSAYSGSIPTSDAPRANASCTRCPVGLRQRPRVEASLDRALLFEPVSLPQRVHAGDGRLPCRLLADVPELETGPRRRTPPRPRVYDSDTRRVSLLSVCGDGV